MKLNEILKQKGISQAALARMAGINQCNVNQICRGKLYPYPAWRKKISDVLGMDEKEIFDV